MNELALLYLISGHFVLLRSRNDQDMPSSGSDAKKPDPIQAAEDEAGSAADRQDLIASVFALRRPCFELRLSSWVILCLICRLAKPLKYV